MLAISLIPLHYFMYRDSGRINSKYCSELYNGTKNKIIFKLYMLFFIVRRFISALILVFLRSVNIWVRCIPFSIVQFTALIYVAKFRPFAEVKSNIIEIMNEVIFSILCIILTVLNQKSMWFPSLANILIYALMSNGFWIIFILSSDITIVCLEKYRVRTKPNNKPIKVEAEDVAPKQFKDNSNKTDITKNDKLITQISKFSSKMENDFESFDTMKDKVSFFNIHQSLLRKMILVSII